MSCQCEQNTPFDGATPAYRRALWWVVVINAGMFLIELSGGWLSGSKALQADALDFLGDTFTYLISLLVIGKALSLRSKVALFKGLTLGLMGAWVLGSTLYRDPDGLDRPARLLRQSGVGHDFAEIPRRRCQRALGLAV
jgi:Co/Zn/Cd efflux system component